jgi:hypothetical protein
MIEASQAAITSNERAMSIPDQVPPTTAPPSLAPVLRGIVRHRGVQTAAALWVIGYVVVLWLAHGSLPFDRPSVARLVSPGNDNDHIFVNSTCAGPVS